MSDIGKEKWMEFIQVGLARYVLISEGKDAESSVVEGLMEQCSVQQHAKEELVKEFNELDKENQQLREQVEKGEEAFKLQWFIYKDLEQEAIELKDQLSKYQGVVDAAEKVSKRYSGDGIPELCESLQRLKESEK